MKHHEETSDVTIRWWNVGTISKYLFTVSWGDGYATSTSLWVPRGFESTVMGHVSTPTMQKR